MGQKDFLLLTPRRLFIRIIYIDIKLFMNIRLGHFLIVVLLMDMINEQNQILFIVSFSDHRQTQKRKGSSNTSPFLESILTQVLDPRRSA